GGGDVGFPIPVFQTKAADIHEATAERSRVADQIQALEAQAEMEVRTAYRACVVAGKTLDSQNRTIVPLSEENAQISQRQFDRDEASASDLIGQQIDLLTARRAQLDAIEAFNTSRVELERVVGGSLTSPTESTPAQ
ncbi:MAG TPA: TolC family protein, partial [Candidatus Acidoferrales bacterium]|nr:TolC family protein [Candidatus Acidoferrales bacterium]